MIPISIGNISYTAPSNWNELSKKDILAAGKYLPRISITHALEGTQKDKRATQSIFKQHLSMRLLGIPKSVWQKLNSFQKVDLMHTLSWVYEDITLTKQVLPHFYNKKACFVGPSSKLSNITFEEFITAERALFQFTQKPSKEHLIDLVAVLYRQKSSVDPSSSNFNGDERQPFNIHTVNQRSKALQTMGIDTAFSIYFFYLGCKNYIAKKHPHVFTKPATSPKKKKTKQKPTAWGEIIIELLVPKYGTVEQCKKLNVYDALGFLNHETFKNKKQNEQLKNKRGRR